MRRTRLAWWLVVGAIAALLVGACGGGGDNDSSDAGGGGGNKSSTEQEGGSDDGGALGDGCEIVTKADATDILGGTPTAKKDESAVTGQSASCVWNYEVGETSFRMLQFRVFDGTQYYGGAIYADQEGFEQIDLGDKGFVVASPSGFRGIDVQCVSHGKTVTFNLSALGQGAELDATAKTKMMALARKVEAALD